MDEYLHLAKKSPLFYGINDDELYTLLKCTAAEDTLYEEGEYIFRMGESMNQVMILLQGKAVVLHENFWGRQEEMYQIREGGDIRGGIFLCQNCSVAGERDEPGEQPRLVSELPANDHFLFPGMQFSHPDDSQYAQDDV